MVRSLGILKTGLILLVLAVGSAEYDCQLSGDLFASGTGFLINSIV